jgi:pyridoxine 5'-phosphate synthase PdxJ
MQDRDIHLLREVIQTQFNLEMAATEEMVRIADRAIDELVRQLEAEK